MRGPFLFAGDEKLVVKAATYGTFAADSAGDLYPPPETVRRDFALMREAGINTVRTYTAPPRWFLDEARASGLRVLAGVFWEGRNCRFDDPKLLAEATQAVRAAVRACRDHPDVVLAYAIGNEIPPLVVRYHGWRVIACFLERLYDVAKREDPDGLVTYGNYPPTEFLQLDFLDFHTLNVYLLQRDALSRYLDRILIQVQGKPLLVGEIGDDSLRRGEDHQADLLDWTIPLVLDKGAAGICVFSWTDEWHVGAHAVDDWRFGLVDAERRPKPALEVVRRRFTESPIARREEPWPRVSVVVCNYNGAATLDETLSSLRELDYPDYEVLYVDDGSTDDSLEIARRHEPAIRIIAQENRGLSVARNVGAEAATGEIVAYTDSDAFADRDWLRQLVLSMESGDFAACGGPNLTPESDGLMAQLIAMCPGNPTYVLEDNIEADHIAGVNMGFRRDALLAIGGFDPIHTRAGDDVDVCWRLEDSGMRIAFSPTAIVWHHRRPSMWRYLKQQYGYGEAENQLERKHPERFNMGGYIRWGGRIYAGPTRVTALFRPFVYHGHLGTGLFQTLYQKDPSHLMYGPAMIHWYLTWIVLLALSPLSVWVLVAAGILFGLSAWNAFVAGFVAAPPFRLTWHGHIRKTAVIAFLHFVHPVVRWWGRVAPLLREKPRRRREPVPLRLRLAELASLLRRPKQQRRYWGLGESDRTRVIREVQAELKARRASPNLGQDWDNFDILMDGSMAAKGHIYTSPEHYDQALCFGFKPRMTTVMVTLLAVTYAVATWLTSRDLRFAVTLLVPAALLYRALGDRARMRWRAWGAIESVMERKGAKRF